LRASARFDAPLLSGRVRCGLVCPRRRRGPGSGPRSSCEWMRVRLRTASSVRFVRMITATGCRGRFLLWEDCHRWPACGDLCLFCVTTRRIKRPFKLVYTQFVRCMYSHPRSDIIRYVGEIIRSSQIFQFRGFSFATTTDREFDTNINKPQCDFTSLPTPALLLVHKLGSYFFALPPTASNLR